MCSIISIQESNSNIIYNYVCYILYILYIYSLTYIHMYEVWSCVIIVIFNFRELRMIDFCIFLLVHSSVIFVYVDNFSHFGLSVCFWHKKRLIVFWCALRFFTIQKNGSRKCIKFCIKNEIKFARTFEMFTVAFGGSSINRTQVQLWYNRFKEGR